MSLGIRAMPLDQLGFLFVEPRQFASRAVIGSQQLVELGVDCLCIAMLGPLDQQGHEQCAYRGDPGPAKILPVEN